MDTFIWLANNLLTILIFFMMACILSQMIFIYNYTTNDQTQLHVSVTLSAVITFLFIIRELLMVDASVKEYFGDLAYLYAPTILLFIIDRILAFSRPYEIRYDSDTSKYYVYSYREFMRAYDSYEEAVARVKSLRNRKLEKKQEAKEEKLNLKTKKSMNKVLIFSNRDIDKFINTHDDLESINNKLKK